MKRVEILVEESLYEFYRKVGAQAGGLPAERVMADALLKLAGELSLQALDIPPSDIVRQIEQQISEYPEP